MRFALILGVLILGLFYPTQCLVDNQTVIVTTKYGDIRGYETGQARVFYGIPFAQPPVKELR